MSPGLAASRDIWRGFRFVQVTKECFAAFRTSQRGAVEVVVMSNVCTNLLMDVRLLLIMLDKDVGHSQELPLAIRQLFAQWQS